MKDRNLTMLLLMSSDTLAYINVNGFVYKLVTLAIIITTYIRYEEIYLYFSFYYVFYV